MLRNFRIEVEDIVVAVDASVFVLFLRIILRNLLLYILFVARIIAKTVSCHCSISVENKGK